MAPGGAREAAGKAFWLTLAGAVQQHHGTEAGPGPPAPAGAIAAAGLGGRRPPGAARPMLEAVEVESVQVSWGVHSGAKVISCTAALPGRLAHALPIRTRAHGKAIMECRAVSRPSTQGLS